MFRKTVASITKRIRQDIADLEEITEICERKIQDTHDQVFAAEERLAQFTEEMDAKADAYLQEQEQAEAILANFQKLIGE